MRETLPYRPNVSIITHRDEEFLIINRYCDEEDEWKFPQGGVDESDEDLVAAGIREFAEELGTDKIDIVGISAHENRYEWPDEQIVEEYDEHGNQWRGQHQRFLVAQFTGAEKDLALCEEEVRAHRWVTREDVLRYNDKDDHRHFSHYNGVIQDILEEFDL